MSPKQRELHELRYTGIVKSVTIIVPRLWSGMHWNQGWEFAHRFSEQIASFLPKNERMSDSLKKTSDTLLRSFLVSDLSDLLTIAYFL